MSELQRLRDRVEELEEMLGIGNAAASHLSCALGLTICQAKMLGILLKRIMVSEDAMYFALYGDRPESDQPESEAVVRKHIMLLRQRLKPTGVEVQAVYGQGWRIVNEHKAKIHELTQ